MIPYYHIDERPLEERRKDFIKLLWALARHDRHKAVRDCAVSLLYRYYHNEGDEDNNATDW